MRKPHVVSQLADKYAQFLGELSVLRPRIEGIKADVLQLPELERRASEIASTLEHIEGSIKIFEPGWTPGEVRPVRPYTARTSFKRGEVWRLAMTLLRNGNQPMTVREIMSAIIRDRHMADVTPVELKSLCKNLATVFRNQEVKGLVVGAGSPKQWSLVRKPKRTAA